MQPVAQCDVRVSPERLGDASPEALAIAGFSLKEWAEASTLEVALRKRSPSGRSTHVTLPLSAIQYLSRNCFGIVVCPLEVTVAEMVMVMPIVDE